MIISAMKRVIDHYSNKPVIMFIRYIKNGVEYPVAFGRDIEISAHPTNHNIEEALKGTQSAVFGFGSWKGGDFNVYVVGKQGYMPKEDMPNG